ncbi:hypothetical protein N7509_012762 [Penicillium cosmopolitanum]|uniref:Uncharacterized protein n=1 Tax=Penicillium cosmopolitanum TaxID=1131564 RepID=A0A9W9VEY5_9EURO|nr:uncharacterized protein N7509_012762 [Penicillium cosmopolitanum]KAJ5379643.1 hypothetical protein N7509_012762 [Penicillium cosmopolitanum]
MDRPKRDSRTRQVVERWREQEHENNYFGFDPVTPLTDKRYKPHQETGNPSRHQKQDIAWHSSTSLYPEEPESRDLPMRLNPEFYRPDSAFHCQTEEKDCNTPDLWGFDPAIPSKQAPIYSEKNWAQSGFNEEKPAGKTTDNMAALTKAGFQTFAIRTTPSQHTLPDVFFKASLISRRRCLDE